MREGWRDGGREGRKEGRKKGREEGMKAKKIKRIPFVSYVSEGYNQARKNKQTNKIIAVEIDHMYDTLVSSYRCISQWPLGSPSAVSCPGL